MFFSHKGTNGVFLSPQMLISHFWKW